MTLKRAVLNQVRKIVKPHHVHLLANYLAGPCELVRGPLNYNQDGLATSHRADFMNEARFREAYALGKQTGSWGEADVHWRAYVACWAGAKARQLAGDFVECGVNRGGLARTVIHYVDFAQLDKKFYLLDTFQGLCEEYLSEQEKVREVDWHYEDCYEAVKRTFAGFNVEIIQGPVPDTLPRVKTEKIAYLSIDMNCALPEIEAAKFFWDKLVPGAVVLLDDYGWENHTEQKIAFDQFAFDRSVQVLPLPTGQGIIIKP